MTKLGQMIAVALAASLGCDDGAVAEPPTSDGGEAGTSGRASRAADTLELSQRLQGCGHGDANLFGVIDAYGELDCVRDATDCAAVSECVDTVVAAWKVQASPCSGGPVARCEGSTFITCGSPEDDDPDGEMREVSFDCAAYDVECMSTLSGAGCSAKTPPDCVTFEDDHCEGSTVRTCLSNLGLLVRYDCAKEFGATCVERPLGADTVASCER